MKIPVNWLKEYVDVTLSVTELAERLTIAGLEIGGVRVIGLPVPDGLRIKQEEKGPVWDPDKIKIARILKVEKHPDADRLTLATLEYGSAEPKTVVTGAPNVKVGMSGPKVIIGLSGSVLIDGHAKEKVLKELKPSKIRGIPSDAMVCSERELGISDEHEGILFLEDDAPVGKPIAEFMGDVVLEADVLPNMARCLSLVGVAREVAALTGGKAKLPEEPATFTGEPVAGQVEVKIEDSKLSARYAAGLIKGVKIGPAPGWLQRRLTYAGMRPINNIVDITNYVMLEWGQPLHAFDYDLLTKRAGGKTPVITVRPARQGETLRTLDDQQRELTPDNLVIADAAGPIALAGVMGGADTEVNAQTTNILLESASFDPISIRQTARAFNLPSEASLRFSRGIHPDTVPVAANRALDLMRQHAAGSVCRGLVDNYPAPPKKVAIEIDMEDVRRTLGVDLPQKEVVRILRGLEFDVEPGGPDMLMVTAPSQRTDIQADDADIIEELARIHGYDRLPATLLADQLPETPGDPKRLIEEQARDILVNAGLQEVITYSLTEPAREQPLQPGDAYVTLKNPISSERAVLRRSLLSSVLEVAARNLRFTSDVRLFEIGAIYVPRPGEKLPAEPRRLAVALTGRRQAEYWQEGTGAKNAPHLDFFDLKGVVAALLGDLHVAEVTFRPAQADWLHPGRAAEVLVKDSVVGRLGQLHPKTAQAYELGGQAILVGDFDLQAIIAAVPARYAYTPVPQFPPALRDIAVVVDHGISSERIAGEIRQAGGELLRAIHLFDVYQGVSIEAGKKSLAFALTYQANDRTLTDKEIDKAHKKIEDRLKHVLKAQIRGQE
ncbi:MAG: phenylalanine--tRNA ligase subunit beta [Gemmataceae bacterium]